MRHMYRIREHLVIAAREQACIVLCVIALVTMAGLFSSCSRKTMQNHSTSQFAEETGTAPAPSPAVAEISFPEAASSDETDAKDSEPSDEAGPGSSTAAALAQPPEGAPSQGAEEHADTPKTKEDGEPSSASSQSEGKNAPAPSSQPGGKTTPTPSPQASAGKAISKPSAEPATAPSEEPAPKAIVNPYVRYTWDQMMDEAQRLQEAYPNLIKLSSAGTSVEGRDLLVIRLGTGNKKVLLCGAHHAREYITSSYLMKMVETYAEKAAKGQTIGNYDPAVLLSKVTLVVVPMVNPDGVNLVNNGLQTVADQEAVAAMAMVKSTYREWKANINGVDLNRQYPAYWNEKYDDVGKPASENYKGTASATEPEVKAMMALARSEDFMLSASFHAKGEVIYWADSGTVNAIDGAKAIAQRIGKETGYALMPISKDPAVYAAGFENWFRQEFLRPSFCIELTPYNNTDKPHDDAKFDSLVWKKARYIGLILAHEALKR